MAKITVYFGSDTQAERTLDRDELRIGRAADCDIVVDNLGVSRLHCTIVRDGNGWTLVDGGSNNGTFVGGQRIDRHPLKDKDRIVLGKHSLVYDSAGTADPNVAAKRKGPTGMGGEMTMFVDQAALQKAMASVVGGKRMALSVPQGGREVLVPLIKDETTIGKAGDVPARGFLVKAVQAKVVRSGSGHRLVSLGGLRAVRVNGVKVAGDSPLKAGDTIVIAGTSFTYKQA
jgi:pSer/pThr/pTyr-binding forkhead associated (FHA) protein